MLFFMHKYIERVVDVKGGNNGGFQVVLGLFGEGEKDRQFICHQLIQKLTMHRESNTMLYEKKNIMWYAPLKNWYVFLKWDIL